MSDVVGWVLGVAVLASCAAAAWWLGRSLARTRDEAGFAERVDAYRSRMIQLGALATAGYIAIVPVAAIAYPTLPLVAIAMWMGWYPARARIYGQSAGLWSHTRGGVTFVAAFFAPWFVAALAPVVTLSLSSTSRPMAFASFAAAVAFFTLADVRRLVLRARRLTGDVSARDQLLGMLANARVANIAVYRFGPRRLPFPVTAATAEGSEPRVYVHESLFGALDDDELTALVARDVAWIELAMPTIAASRRVGLFFRLVALAATAATVWLVPDPGGWAVAAWVGLALAAQMYVAKDAPSDLARDRRAVELCGDLDALVRAIEKHAALRFVPRRSDPTLENAEPAYNASLARRLQALRELANDSPYRQSLPAKPPRAATLPAFFRSSDDKTWFVFEGDRLHVLGNVQPEPAQTTLEALQQAAGVASAWSYSALCGVALSMHGGPTLVLSELGQPDKRLPIAESDIARLQAVLDDIDGKLGSRAQRPSHGFAGALAFVVAAGAIGSLGGVSPVPLLLFAIWNLMARTRRAAASLAGCAWLAAVWNGLSLAQLAPPTAPRGVMLAEAAACIALGIAALVYARTRPDGAAQGNTTARLWGVLLAMIAALVSFGPLANGTSMTWLMLEARLPLFAGACAGALAISRLWIDRGLGCALAGGSLAVIAAVQPLMGAFVPLETDALPVGAPLALETIASFPRAPAAPVLRLEPGGERVAQQAPGGWQVHDRHGGVETLAGLDVAFPSPGLLLVLTNKPPGSELQLTDLSSGRVIDRQTFDHQLAASMALIDDGTQWLVTTQSADGAELFHHGGELQPALDGSGPRLASRDSLGLDHAARRSYVRSAQQALGRATGTPVTDEQPHQQGYVACPDAPRARGPVACVAVRPEGTVIIKVRPDTGAAEVVGLLDGAIFHEVWLLPDGDALVVGSDGAMWVDLREERPCIRPLALPAVTTAAVANDGTLAVAFADAVTTYRIAENAPVHTGPRDDACTAAPGTPVQSGR